MFEKQQKIDDKMAAKKEKLMQKQIAKQQKEAEKERKKGVYKEKYLEKRSRSRSRSRRASKVYGSDVANASGHFGLGSSSSLARPDQGSADIEATEAAEVPPVPALPLDRTVSAISTIGPDGKKHLRPELERQATTIETSDSEDGMSSQGRKTPGKEDKADVEAAPAQGVVTDSNVTSPKSPIQQVGRLFHKLTHRKKDKATSASAEAAGPESNDHAAVPSAREMPVIAAIDTAASGDESESSFQRHSALPRTTRDDSSDSSWSDGEPERGRRGRRHQHRSRLEVDSSDDEQVESGILPSTKALVTGEERVAAVPDPAMIERPQHAGTSKRDPVERSFSSATGMSTATADEEFEEAKDTFDPHASSVQNSTSADGTQGVSPGRETKFREEV